jgi:hypothetical protein
MFLAEYYSGGFKSELFTQIRRGIVAQLMRLPTMRGFSITCLKLQELTV